MSNGTQIGEWMDGIVKHSHGEFTTDELKQVIERGSHHAWAWCEDGGAVVGMFVTTVVSYSGDKCLSIIGAAGSVQDAWDEASDILMGMAKHMECVTAEIRGREGFAKRFKNSGWELKYVTLSKAV